MLVDKVTQRISLLLTLILFFSLSAYAADTAPMRVGVIVPLSGPLGQFGEAIRNGVTLAKEKHPMLAERISFHYEDSRYDSKTAVGNFHKLRTADKVQALYVFGGPISAALAPVAERAALPMFSTEYDVRYTKDKKYVLRFANNAEDYAQALLRNLRSRKLKRFGIIKVENQYHNTLVEAFTKSLAEEESAKVVYNFQPGETDFRAAISNLRTANYDALGIYLTPGMQRAFFGQLQSSPVRLPLFGTDTFESREENRGVEQLVEGALFANSAVSEEFVNAYKKRFNSITQIVHAALAYEFALLLADKLDKNPAPNTPEEIVQLAALDTGRNSVCGEYFYKNRPATGQYFSFPIAIREIRSGEPKIISVQEAP